MSYFLAVIYMVLVFLPNEIAAFVGSVRLEPYRIILLLAAAGVIANVLKKPLESFEKYLLASVLWSMLAILVKHGSGGIQTAIIYFLEVWVGFYIGYFAIRNKDKFISLIKIYFGFLVVLAPFAILESQTGYRLLHVVAGQVSGVYGEPYLAGDYFRYGVHRSSTIFSHPILYAVCTAAVMPFLFSRARLSKFRILYWGASFCALYAAMTSAAFLMVMIIIFLRIVDLLSKKISGLKSGIIYGFWGMVIFLEIFSNQGAIRFLMNIVALNPGTAFMRYLQIEFSKDDILSHPFFGISGDWTRPFWIPPSIDNYWIVVALDSGLPGLILLVLFWYTLAMALYRHRMLSPDRLMFFSFTSVFALGVAAITVDYFDRAQILIYFLFGMYAGLLNLLRENSVVKN